MSQMGKTKCITLDTDAQEALPDHIKIINEPIDKVLKPSINGRICYCRIPIARKIMGTGARDSEILINSGIPKSMSDLSYHLITGAYSFDNTLVNQKDYCASFSTTRLLQLLPSTFNRNGMSFGIMLHPGEIDGFGRSSLVGIIINMESGEPIEEFHGHPVTVLVKLIEFAVK